MRRLLLLLLLRERRSPAFVGINLGLSTAPDDLIVDL